jgi:hypothetical protein
MRISVPPGLRALANLWAALIWLGAVVAIVGLVFAMTAPPQDQPWTPLKLDAPLGLATDFKFRLALRDPERCRAVLREAGIAFSEAPMVREGPCNTACAVRLQGGVTPLSPDAPVMSCPVALAYAFWTKHAVQPAAREILATSVTRIDHFGTYNCRTIHGRRELSQHANANAIDVSGFRLRDGRRATVAADFHRDDAKGRFLRQSRDGACRWFSAVLSPDFNADHADHLHLDEAAWGMCR